MIAAEGVEHAAGLEAEALVTRPHQPTWEALLEAARGADVLVCGARGRSDFARTILGSTSTSLLHHADLPLLVIPDDVGTRSTVRSWSPTTAHPRPTPRSTSWGASCPAARRSSCTSTCPSTATATPSGRSLTARWGRSCRRSTRPSPRRPRTTTQQGVARAQAAGLDATGETIEASKGVWRTITALVEDRGAALVVTGSRGIGGARSVLIGSVSSGLVGHADTPVLVMHAPEI